MATNKTNSKTISQLSSPLLDVDTQNDALEAWAEARLNQTLGSRVSTATPPPVPMMGGEVAPNPIFNVTMPPIPQPTI